MLRIIQPLRFLAVCLMVACYLVTMPIVWVVRRGRWNQTWGANRLLSMYSRLGLWLLNVRVHPVGLENIVSIPRGALYVGNHHSYIDVLVIAAYVPACFVTSVEIKNTPGLGIICRMAGCLFVERRNKMNLRNEVGELADGLSHAVNVAIFPEATSSNGEELKRFRKALYVSAISTQKPVIPFCLNYTDVGNRPINRVTRDSIFWYGDMDFVPHLWALCGSGGVDVSIHFLNPIYPSAVDDAGTLADASQTQVLSVFKPVKKEEGSV